MNPSDCYTADAVAQNIAGTTDPLLVGAVIACWVGSFGGQAMWYGLHHFVLRRIRSWLRYQRAVEKVHP